MHLIRLKLASLRMLSEDILSLSISYHLVNVEHAEKKWNLIRKSASTVVNPRFFLMVDNSLLCLPPESRNIRRNTSVGCVKKVRLFVDSELGFMLLVCCCIPIERLNSCKFRPNSGEFGEEIPFLLFVCIAPSGWLRGRTANDSVHFVGIAARGERCR